MEEAEALCDRVAVFHRGRIVALDSPSRLIARTVGNLLVTLRIPDGSAVPRLSAIPGVRGTEYRDETLTVYAEDDRAVAAVVQQLVEQGVPSASFESRVAAWRTPISP